ncbi:MAG: efflux RND transporter permease subunit [Opitutales bacterium]|nr:efflux RND transporter permease subunit [Opitutales bacterium]
MIERLIDLCLRHRGLVVLLVAGLAVLGIWSTQRVTVDAIPDLGEVQVVVRVDYPGQAPQVLEDQVINPLTRGLLAVPKARDVRGFSMFGTGFVYVLFEDGTDLYWARARVQEQLATLTPRLPEQAELQLGPDASGVGWVYQYVLTTGKYSPEYPNGFWYDAEEDHWYTDKEAVPADARQRIERIRVFPAEGDQESCPVSGRPLRAADVDLSELRSLQDWYLRDELTALRGVSEVASAGGMVKEYQVVLDPYKLEAYNLTLGEIERAVSRSNRDVGGGLVEIAEMEYMVRSYGFLGTLRPEQREGVPEDGLSLRRLRTEQVLQDLKAIPLRRDDRGVPLLLEQVADITLTPASRRGIVTWNDQGEAVGGIIVMRHLENARDVIERVERRLGELEAGLPAGVAVETAYDRSDLIDRSLQTLRATLLKEMLAVTLVILLFLWHVRSAVVAAVVLPTAVLLSVAVMHFLGINANIMSLGGIAIAVGVMVDCSIVMVDNAHQRLQEWKEKGGGDEASRVAVLGQSAREVGPALFFSLLVITVSFLPVFLLGEQAGRLFHPLAYTKTFTMAAAAVLAVTLIPVLLVFLVRDDLFPDKWGRGQRWGVRLAAIILPALVLAYVPLGQFASWRWPLVGGWLLAMTLFLLRQEIRPAEKNPLVKGLVWGYRPVFHFALRFRWPLVLGSVALVIYTFTFPLRDLGTEFMPPLEEGDLLYMPTTVEPGLSPLKARELLQHTDKLISNFPEVKTVKGKIGRAETATDPAPLNMIETTIVLHRDKKEWRHVPRERFFTNWPSWARWLPSKVFSESRPITQEELIYGFEWEDGRIIPGLDTAVQIPGLANSWTQPIRTRIDMLSTGIRTPVGIKVMGEDLTTLGKIAAEVEQILMTDAALSPHTASAYAERTTGGKYLDIRPLREEVLGRYGLTVEDVQEMVETAMAGRTITETVEGLERYPVSVRWAREYRDNLPALRDLRVTSPEGRHIPLGEVAEISLREGPPMIKSENARLTAWVYAEVRDLDVGTYVQEAQRAVAENLDLPPGYSLVWSGQFEYLESARENFMVAIPLTLLAIFVLLYLATRSFLRVLLIFSTLTFSVIGAIWFVWLLDYNLSVAVVIGIIALLGLDAETSLIMLLYLDQAYDRHRKEGKLVDTAALRKAIYEGAVMRIRPKTMTVLTTIAGLMPLLFATGAGADTMRRLAAPMIGGLVTSFILELVLYPAIYYLARKRGMPK